ncbi:MAG: DUF58 domain-containing protein, partial [Clostridiales bacterium]|nr:DUF58 domain-containing protein [Clostridiales bacterium]
MENGTLIEVITNGKKLPLPFVCVKFITSKYLSFKDKGNSCITDKYYRNDLFSLLGYQKITRTLDFTAIKRGYYTLSDITLLSSDILMSKNFTQNIKNKGYIYVYPRQIQTKDFQVPKNSLLGSILTQKSLYEDPLVFNGLKEYEPYDNINSINWKATAKVNSIMVNKYSKTSSLQIDFYLNVELPPFSSNGIIEDSISIVSSLCRYFLENEIEVSLNTNGIDCINDSIINISSSTGKNQLNKINHSLSRIDLTKSPENFIDIINKINKETSSSLKILVSSYVNKDLIDKLNEIKIKHKNVILIIPCYYSYKNEIINNIDIIRWRLKG